MRLPKLLAIAVLAVGVVASGWRPAWADQTDPRLDQLFDALKDADGAQAAGPIEERIWGIWSQSNDSAVDDLMALGVASLNQADYGQALAAFDRVVQLVPKFAEGWNKRATVLYLMRRFDDSRKDIDRVLALEPRHFGALSGLGMCDMQEDRIKEALDAFQRARALDPNLPGVAQNIDELKKRLTRESI